MSNYRNFSVDFPGRCQTILNRVSAQLGPELEATLLLMSLASILTVPKERLRLDTKHLAGEAAKLPALAWALRSEEAKPFKQSAFWAGEGSTWAMSVLDLDGPSMREWPDNMGTVEPLSDQNVGQILACLRNSLSHGNTVAEGDPIKALVFLSRKLGERPRACDRCGNQPDRPHVGYTVVRASLSDVRTFIDAWCAFLKKHSETPA